MSYNYPLYWRKKGIVQGLDSTVILQLEFILLTIFFVDVNQEYQKINTTLTQIPNENIYGNPPIENKKPTVNW